MKRRPLLIAAFALLSAALAAPAADWPREVLERAGLAPALREELQRPVDARLLRIEAGGIEGSGLFKGRIHVVRSAEEVRALSGKLHPGDQLVLAGANWHDAKFTFGGLGTEAAPILIRPEAGGAVVFSGNSEVGFHGSHLVITGLEFRKVTVARTGAVIFRLGVGKERPADHCIVNRITIENCNSPSPADWPRLKVWYLTAGYGRDNTIANSTFSGLRHIGQMIGAAELPPGELQRLHLLDNRFGDRPYLDEQNGYEIIQIGWSGERARSAGSLIRGNVFENCDGENEIITLKASDVFVRGNTFAGCQGVLCLRSANRVFVEGNVFDGRGRAGTGGVRLQGADHVVVGNVFRDLKTPPNYYCWPVSLMAASAENYGDGEDLGGYGRAKRIVIAGNRFERCDARIAAGIYPRPAYPLLPREIHVYDNVFVGTMATTAFGYAAPDPTGALTRELHESGNRFLP